MAPARIPAVIAVPSGETQIGHAIYVKTPRPQDLKTSLPNKESNSQ
jgi:hypothetical protein